MGLEPGGSHGHSWAERASGEWLLEPKETSLTGGEGGCGKDPAVREPKSTGNQGSAESTPAQEGQLPGHREGRGGWKVGIKGIREKYP